MRSKQLAGVLALVAALAALLLPTMASAEESNRGPAVVIANRGSGDLTVIDSATLTTETVDLPGTAEPMYVNHDRFRDVVVVGDRAASTVWFLDDETYDVVDSVAVGDGVFHQWVDPYRHQLWVVGDTSRTVTVININEASVLATIDIPADLVERGGVPHDVFVAGNRAFVSILNLDDGTGVVLQYSTRTFAETGRISTGGDPHLFVDGRFVYVASQFGSTVSRYRVRDLAPRGTIDIPAAHGIFITDRNEVLVTNITGGGTDAVWELNRALTRVRDIVDTSVPVPHNITVDGRRQMFITHSGAAADQVSIIDLERRGFGDVTTVTAGTNPFGLAYVP